MTERLRRLTPGELTDDQTAVYEAITGGPRRSAAGGTGGTGGMTDAAGGLYGPFNAMLLSPPLGNALQALGAAIRYQSALSSRIREMAILTVADFHDSAFERHAHEEIALRSGLSATELARLRSAGTPSASPDQADQTEEIALRAVRALLREHDLDDDLYAQARNVLGDEGLFELSTLVGYYSTLALQLRLFRVGLPERPA